MHTELHSDEHRADNAVTLADRLLRESEAGLRRGERRRQERLGRIVGDPAARELVQRLTDEVLRLDRPSRSAARFRALVRQHRVPTALGPVDRLLMRVGAASAAAAPWAVMPIAKRRIVAETHGLVLPADDRALARHLAERTQEDTDVNLNVLGEAILSDDEAEERLRRVIAVMERPDVHYVSVKISALCAQLEVFDFEGSVARVCAALRRLYDTARRQMPVTFVNLDMEEYAELHLTVEAFVRVLSEPAYLTLSAGIVLQAYLPDSHGVLERIGEWARSRLTRGGAPVKVRIVKGANLAMEQVDAELHGWTQAPYGTKEEVDGSFKRLLDTCLDPQWDGALRVGVASHNLFDLAWALTLRDELPPDRRPMVDLEMLEGMVPAQSRAVRAAAGGLLLYCPVVRRNEIEASLAYLARRFDENTAPDNFLRAMFSLHSGSAEFAHEAARFRTAVAQRHTVSVLPRRPGVSPRVTALQSAGEFANQPDADLTDSVTRARFAASLAAPPEVRVDVTGTVTAIDAAVARALEAQSQWATLTTDDHAGVLRRVAALLDSERHATAALMAHEAAKTVREGDPEVSEAVDFARYYATTPPPSTSEPYGVVLVASPWNFPYAIPASGVFAALMAGNAVILKPAPETRRTGRWLAEQCWRAGVPPELLQYVACPDDEVGRRLVTHPDVATVVLTGAYGTAEMFLDWKPSLRLLAETSGKNAIVVTEAADRDAAIGDIVRSAFGHAGQKCSAASVAILEGPVYESPSFLKRLASAVRTLRVGPATDPSTAMGPLISPPTAPLLRALTMLDEGESWLVQPRQLDDGGRLWSPGVKIGVEEGSWFHRTECFGPVLGVMRADDLQHALRVQNGTDFGLTGGIHSLDDAEVREWLSHVRVGNAYVNRHVTGAVVRRQPFGGWKRSSVGGGPKAGGPDYVGSFARPREGPVDAEAARRSYEAAWSRRFGVELDAAGLRSESNVHRYRPLHGALVRYDGSAPSGVIAAARHAAALCGVSLLESDADCETDDFLAARLADLRPDRLRLLAPAGDALLRRCHQLDVAVITAPVSAEGDSELGHWLHEQAISRTLHRYGRVPD